MVAICYGRALVCLALLVVICRINAEPGVVPSNSLFAAPDLGDNLKSGIDTVIRLLELARTGNNYIVVLKSSQTSEFFTTHLQDVQDRLNSDSALGRIFHTYAFGTHKPFRGYAGTFHPSVVQWIRSLPFVENVDRDDPVKCEAVADFTIQTTVPSWGLNRIWQRNGTRVDGYRYNKAAGVNVDVYVLDTGVMTTHEDFEGRAVDGKSFVTEANSDQNGHGSHVAGIISGINYGVAKKTNIIAVKVLGADGRGAWSGIIAGLNWVAENQKQTGRRSVINVSISGTLNQAVNTAFDAVVTAGIPVVVAAGNSNDNSCQYSPAAASKVISVGSINSQDSRSSFSNYGACVHINAPGESITSVGLTSNTANKVMTGTSMASPHVVGSIAVILSQHNLTPDQLRRYLMASSTQNTIKGLVSNTTSNLVYSQPDDLLTSTLIDSLCRC